MGERSMTLHYLLRSAILAGFSFYIIHLVRSGDMMYYIAPRMEPYVKYAAFGLTALAIHQAFAAVQSLFGTAESCGCDHVPPRSMLMNGMIYGLFLFPLLLGFLMPNMVMGSSVASVKGMNFSGANNVSSRPAGSANPVTTPSPMGMTDVPSGLGMEANADRPGNNDSSNGSERKEQAGSQAAVDEEKLQELFRAEEFFDDLAKLGMKLYLQEKIDIEAEGFMEILSTLDLFMDNFIGKPVEISGFVYRENEMSPNQFAVARLAISCCAADASPYGVMVEASSAGNYAEDTWVRITGTIGKTLYNDNEIVQIDAENIEKIDAPESPYVYPDYYYFDDL
ncbi:Domain of uncharacterised function (DUF1980) [Chlamydia abortus]|uniref:TIGR03943 family putative permease subunit n=1 Tax=Paenibacillus residui TaxID=629724 RepID=A0ABW3D946_9BACL|nr:MULTISPECIES: TIGR03943 family protein [Paenibacillaceae]SHE10896.1 Domain of uncharacterised function (DUF1980) [Chlamydia abortus]